MKIVNDQFFKINPEKYEYLGERYFRMSWDGYNVLQICISPGSIGNGRGRTKTIGIYTISRLTFLSNYYGMNYVRPCTKKMFIKKFDDVVKLMRGEEK